jgi:hypothetical protein
MYSIVLRVVLSALIAGGINASTAFLAAASQGEVTRQTLTIIIVGGLLTMLKDLQSYLTAPPAPPPTPPTEPPRVVVP